MDFENERKLSNERNNRLLKSQQFKAKKRRVIKDEADLKYSILYTFKQPLIKYVRSKQISDA